MSKIEKFDLAILGAGSGGLVIAAVAAQLGYKVALFEGGKMGGDCLNYGCVPSKALLAAAKAAQTSQQTVKFGISTKVHVDFPKVMQHVQDVIAQIAPHDSIERFESYGVTVIQEYGYFIDKKTIGTPTGRQVAARRIIIATGSKPALPTISGLEKISYLTNETIFDLKQRPKHLAIIGGGPIGIEMAQAFSRLGSKITVFQSNAKILPHDDSELTEVLHQSLQEEGITICTECKINQVSQAGGNITLDTNSGSFKASHLLVATGRQPNVENLCLEKAGVDYDAHKGVYTNSQQRTSNPNIFAVGDVTGLYRFTHMAADQATIFIKRVLFGNFLTKRKHHNIPWVTYTDPELAHIGLTLEQAKQRYGDKVTVTTVKAEDVDRNRTERATTGLLKIITDYKGRILGVNALSAHAGELLPVWGLMIHKRMKLSELSNVIHAYPTFSEINRKAVSAYYSKALYAPKTQKISRWLFRLFG
ncbi:MAG: FAD-dependent oxidoreductase [Alphaproteobacteria bacterium]|nr:FAD-dependent oxidoreductase [Alphaproteobacteria bacterium]MDD9919223.1 FAD-dependent oxidoreductase [Alphaproteobacteria bacterium]